jgi:hypothetical protein
MRFRPLILTRPKTSVDQTEARNNSPIWNIGWAIAGPDGVCPAMSATLLDGSYAVTATITPSQGGAPSAPVPLVNGSLTPSRLAIDTVALRVASLLFKPKAGMIAVALSDSGSSLDPNTT